MQDKESAPGCEPGNKEKVRNTNYLYAPEIDKSFLIEQTSNAELLAAITSRYPKLSANGWDNNSRFAFSLSDMEMVRACIQWIQHNIIPTKTIRHSYSSYYYKHRVERSEYADICKGYVCNGAFIAAALLLGYRREYTSSGINCVFNMKANKNAVVV